MRDPLARLTLTVQVSGWDSNDRAFIITRIPGTSSKSRGTKHKNQTAPCASNGYEA